MNIGAAFPWTGEGDARPVGYFHFEPGEAFVGGGLWHPDKAPLHGFRRLVDGDAARVHAITDDPAFAATFGSLIGDRLTRVPQGYRADHPEADLLRLKNIGFSHRLSDADLASRELPDQLVASLATGVPMLRLLATLPIS